MIIAVDGPAASGKGTIAKALARHYGLPHLDTGLLYRAVAATVLRHGARPGERGRRGRRLRFRRADCSPIRSLRDDEIGKLASIVSAHPLVRAALLQRQKRFAHQPGGAVLDGRDIGTVIAPDADAKLFVKATPTIRARRRHAELQSHGSIAQLRPGAGRHPRARRSATARARRAAGAGGRRGAARHQLPVDRGERRARDRAGRAAGGAMTIARAPSIAVVG